MSNEKKIQKLKEEYIYKPEYNDRYIQHLESLSKDSSATNKINSEIAKMSLDGIKIVTDYNRHITECIRELKGEKLDHLF